MKWRNPYPSGIISKTCTVDYTIKVESFIVSFFNILMPRMPRGWCLHYRQVFGCLVSNSRFLRVKRKIFLDLDIRSAVGLATSASGIPCVSSAAIIGKNLIFLFFSLGLRLPGSTSGRKTLLEGKLDCSVLIDNSFASGCFEIWTPSPLAGVEDILFLLLRFCFVNCTRFKYPCCLIFPAVVGLQHSAPFVHYSGIVELYSRLGSMASFPGIEALIALLIQNFINQVYFCFQAFWYLVVWQFPRSS